ncbi:hypothetical protein BKA62DRAFT_757405, partial [Auriculariales sp. MPI-PUGE-AT-0066]
MAARHRAWPQHLRITIRRAVHVFASTASTASRPYIKPFIVRWMSGTRWTQLTLVTASTIRATEAPLGTRIFILSSVHWTSSTRQTRQTPTTASTIGAQKRHLELGISLSISATRQTRQTPISASTIRATEPALRTRVLLLRALDVGDAVDAVDACHCVDHSRHRSATWNSDFYSRQISATRQTPISASTIRATEPALRTRVFIIGSVRWMSGTRWTQLTLVTASTIRATEAPLGTRIFILGRSRRRGRRQSPRRLFAPQNQHLELGFLYCVHWTSATRQTRQTPTSASTVGATVAGLGTRVFILGSVRWTSATRQTRQTPTTASTIGATELSLELGISLSHALDLGDAADAADANLRVDHSRHRTALRTRVFIIACAGCRGRGDAVDACHCVDHSRHRSATWNSDFIL